jgi:DNA-binding response OmpR family regulator
LSRVLVVEDEYLTALGLQADLLAQGCHEVQLATTAKEALAVFEQQTPDLVFLDINLGTGMDGVTLGTLLRQRSPVPILFMTAYSDQETVQRATRLHPSAFLCKPVHSSQLRASLMAALDRSCFPGETPVQAIALNLVDQLARMEARLQEQINQLEDRLQLQGLSSLWGQRFLTELQQAQTQGANLSYLARRLLGLIHSQREGRPVHPLALGELLPPLVRTTLGEYPFRMEGDGFTVLGDSFLLLLLLGELLELAAILAPTAATLRLTLDAEAGALHLTVPNRAEDTDSGLQEQFRIRLVIARELARNLCIQLSHSQGNHAHLFSLRFDPERVVRPRESTGDA